MRRYIINFFLAAIIAASFFFAVSRNDYLQWRMFDPEYGMWSAKTKLIEASKKKHITLILGDSRIMAAYKPSTNNKNSVFNLALGGGTPVEAFQILRRLVNEQTQIRQLLISFAPGHFEHHDTFLGRAVLFNFYTNDEFKEITKYSANGSLFDADMDKVKYCNQRLPMCYTSYIKYIFVPGRYEKNINFYNDTLSSNGWHLFGMDTPMKKPADVRSTNFQPNPTLDTYFEKLIYLAKEKNIKLTYYLTPLEHSSYKLINMSYRNEFLSYLKHKAPNMEFFDGGPVPSELMGDGSHVNLLGAEFVTNDVNNRIFHNIF
jgi:hypothetical protein